MSAPYLVCFDLETQTCVPRRSYGAHRQRAIGAMKISVACAFVVPWDTSTRRPGLIPDLETGALHVFWIDDNENMAASMEPLLQLFDGASLICGYNVLDFDFTVLQKHYCSGAKSPEEADRRYFTHRAKTHDIFSRVKNITDFWYKLDDLLKENGLDPKEATGLQAVEMWKNNERTKLAEYCSCDARLTAYLGCLPELALPKQNGYTVPVRLPHSAFGVGAAFLARSWSPAQQDTGATKRRAVVDTTGTVD